MVEIDGRQVGHELVDVAERLGLVGGIESLRNSSTVSLPAAWCSRSSAAARSRSSSEARICGSAGIVTPLRRGPGTPAPETAWLGDRGEAATPAVLGGKHPGAVLGDRDGVLEVRGRRPVGADHGPAVIQQPGLARAEHQHRLDGQRHPGDEQRPAARPAVVRHGGVHVHLGADAVARRTPRRSRTARPPARCAPRRARCRSACGPAWPGRARARAPARTRRAGGGARR